jgi:hypothetical protein
MNCISLISSKANSSKNAAQMENNDSSPYLVRLFHDSKMTHLRRSLRLLIRICHQSIRKKQIDLKQMAHDF